MNISKSIISIRESKGIKQYEVAEKLGIEAPNYSRLEKRGDKLTIEQLSKIANALDVSLNELIFGTKSNELEASNKLKEVQEELKTYREIQGMLVDYNNRLKVDSERQEEILVQKDTIIKSFYINMRIVLSKIIEKATTDNIDIDFIEYIKSVLDSIIVEEKTETVERP